MGSYGKSDPMQAWDVASHYDSVEQACVNTEELLELPAHQQPLMGFNLSFTHFEKLGCVILDATHAWVLRDLTKKNPRQKYITTLEALSDKEVAVTLNSWNFQSDQGTTINVLEKHITPLR